MAIDITKGIEPFNDQTDFSRNNAERKPFGKSNGADGLNFASEYETAQIETQLPVVETKPPVVETPAPKFTHKLSNGETLEAASVEELATKIENALKQQAPAVET